MKKTTIQEKYNTISKSSQNHLKHKPSNTIDKLNIDLNVDNYTINDVFIRLSIDEDYDYYKLHQKVEEKIKAISKLNLNLEEKK